MSTFESASCDLVNQNNKLHQRGEEQILKSCELILLPEKGVSRKCVIPEERLRSLCGKITIASVQNNFIATEQEAQTLNGVNSYLLHLPYEHDLLLQQAYYLLLS